MNTTNNVYLHPNSSDDSNPNKPRKVDRACDACRRRKTKCDGPTMPENVCTNCRQTKNHCTYLEASKPRGPPKAYVTGLENRMLKLEALLKQLRPEDDFFSEIGPPVIPGSWTQPETLTNVRPSYPSSHQSDSRHDTPSMSDSHSPLQDRHPKPRERALGGDGNIDSTLSGESSGSDFFEMEGIDGLMEKLTLHKTEVPRTLDNNTVRFYGNSSAVKLIDATRKFKLMHRAGTLGDPKQTSDAPNEGIPVADSSTRRPEFWHTPRWERLWEGVHIDSQDLLSSVLAELPPQDLAFSLIDLYFFYVNPQLPLLHRPTFDRQWGMKLHHTNIWFAGLCASLFAVASRWTNDPRVLKQGANTIPGEPDWSLAGWNYLDLAIAIHRARQSLFHSTDLFELQNFTLIRVFLSGTDHYPVGWILDGIGIRKAQDLGAHRRKVYRNKPSIDGELWKRAFWCLVVLERMGSEILGRTCCVGEEDFDIDLPLEVDDEYWEGEDPAVAFKQPAGKPAQVSAFNQFIKLSQIIAFVLKSLYAVNSLKLFHGLTPADWYGEVVRQMDIALSQWVTTLPEHLVWSPQMAESSFASEATTLRIAYHLTQMLIYRPFIPPPSLDPLRQSQQLPLSYPAMDICIEAARACARIAEVQLQRGLSKVPIIMHAAQLGAGILLVRIWDLKFQEKLRSYEDVKPLVQLLEPLIEDVGIFIHVLELSEPRWRFFSSSLHELRRSLPPEAPFDPGSRSTSSQGLPLPPPLPHTYHHWQWQTTYNTSAAYEIPPPPMHIFAQQSYSLGYSEYRDTNDFFEEVTTPLKPPLNQDFSSDATHFLANFATGSNG